MFFSAWTLSPRNIEMLKALFFLLVVMHFLSISLTVAGGLMAAFFEIWNSKYNRNHYPNISRNLLTISAHEGILAGGLFSLIGMGWILQKLFPSLMSFLALRCAGIFFFILLGFVFLYIQRRLRIYEKKYFRARLFCCFLGSAFVFLGYGLVVSIKVYFLHPHTWDIEKVPISFFFSDFLLMYSYWLTMAFSITGVAILLQNYKKEKERLAANRLGLALIFLFSLLQPIISFLQLIQFSESAMSAIVITSYIGAVFFGMIVCTTGYLAFTRKNQMAQLIMIICVYSVIFLSIVYEQTAYDNILQEEFAALQITTFTEQKVSISQELEKGKELYEKLCSRCHSIRAEEGIAPSFKGIWGRHQTIIRQKQEKVIIVDDSYIRQSIQRPQLDIVKNYEKFSMPVQELNDKQISSLISYLKTLKFEVKINLSAAKRGKKIYYLHCLRCHSLDQSKSTGPSLKNIWEKERSIIRDGRKRKVIADELYLRKSTIDHKTDILQGYEKAEIPDLSLREKEFYDLMQYLKLISKGLSEKKR